MKLSIVATMYHSMRYIEEFVHRSAKVAEQLVGDDYEIILVNDGSPDASLEVAVSLLKKGDFPLKIVDLSRNFGHHKAMMTGCMHATGELVFLIDIDLEEPPECLIPFKTQMQETCSDVVYGVQERRKGKWFERVSGALFYKVFNYLSSVKIPRNMLTARLMTRRYVNELVRYQEREMSIGGLWELTGFKQTSQVVKKLSISPTTYTLRRKIGLVFQGITSFSTKPLIMICELGFTITVVALIYVTFLVVSVLMGRSVLSGWTSLIVSIWLLGGIMISSIGLIGIYIAKIYIEVKQRPYSSIRRIYTVDDADGLL